jgi:hypothetical protein
MLRLRSPSPVPDQQTGLYPFCPSPTKKKDLFARFHVEDSRITFNGPDTKVISFSTKEQADTVYNVIRLFEKHLPLLVEAKQVDARTDEDSSNFEFQDAVVSMGQDLRIVPKDAKVSTMLKAIKKVDDDLPKLSPLQNLGVNLGISDGQIHLMPRCSESLDKAVSTLKQTLFAAVEWGALQERDLSTIAPSQNLTFPEKVELEDHRLGWILHFPEEHMRNYFIEVAYEKGSTSDRIQEISPTMMKHNVPNTDKYSVIFMPKDGASKQELEALLSQGLPTFIKM